MSKTDGRIDVGTSHADVFVAITLFTATGPT